MSKTTITATVKAVKLFNNETSNVQITLDKQFPGFVQGEDGSYVEAEVSTLSFHPSYLTALACEHSEDFAEFRACCEHKLTQAQFAIALMGATIKFARELHAQGEVLEGQEDALERDCYTTEIIDLSIGEKAQARLEAVIMAKLMA